MIQRSCPREKIQGFRVEIRGFSDGWTGNVAYGPDQFLTAEVTSP